MTTKRGRKHTVGGTHHYCDFDKVEKSLVINGIFCPLAVKPCCQCAPSKYCRYDKLEKIK